MTTDQLSTTFAALADPIRRKILGRLAEHEATVHELAETFSITPQAISKHLKVLERAELITRDKEGQRRPCRLRTEPLDDSANWIEHYRKAVEGRLDRLEKALTELQQKHNEEEQ